MKLALSSLPAGAPPDSVARGGGGAGWAELTGGPGGGGQGGGPSAMAGLMAEVSWKVLERRARTKRSGLAGWDATPSLLPQGCSPSSALGGRQIGVLE